MKPVIILLLLFSVKLFGQTDSSECRKLNELADKLNGSDIVMAGPVFTGGLDSLKKITANPPYPDSAKKAGVEGKVMIGFIVDTYGLCNCFKVVKGIGYGCDEVALKYLFKLPKDWKKVNDSLYVLKSYDKAFRFWSSFLSKGHQPWRYDPKNAAAQCLWDFGITDDTPVYKFAEHLKEIKRNKTYQLDTDSFMYIIHITTRNNIPVADRFVVRTIPGK